MALTFASVSIQELSSIFVHILAACRNHLQLHNRFMLQTATAVVRKHIILCLRLPSAVGTKVKVQLSLRCAAAVLPWAHLSELCLCSERRTLVKMHVCVMTTNDRRVITLAACSMNSAWVLSVLLPYEKPCHRSVNGTSRALVTMAFYLASMCVVCDYTAPCIQEC